MIRPPMKCNRGHTSPAGLWNCPVCTDPTLDTLRRTMPALELASRILRNVGASPSEASGAADSLDELVKVAKR